MDKSKLMELDPKQLKMRYVANELQGLRAVLNYLYDGEQGAFNALYFIKQNYKEWDKIFIWLKNNGIKGKKLVEFFQNESTESGRGYHLGVVTILNKLDGNKNFQNTIKVDRLI